MVFLCRMVLGESCKNIARRLYHWQFWILVHDNGQDEALEMPDVYRREMLADWRALSGDNTSIRDAILHPVTHKWIESQL